MAGAHDNDNGSGAMRKPWKIAVCVVGVLGISGCGSGETNPHDATTKSGNEYSLWEAMRQVAYNMPTYPTLRGNVEAADLAVIGDVIDAQPGRILGTAGTPDAVETTHLRIRVEQVLHSRSGDQPTEVTLEMVTPARESNEALATAAEEEERSIFLLSDLSALSSADSTSKVDGQSLYGLTSSDGLMLDGMEEVVFPFADDQPAFTKMTGEPETLQDIAEQVLDVSQKQ
jgi:hypothetical protein